MAPELGEGVPAFRYREVLACASFRKTRVVYSDCSPNYFSVLFVLVFRQRYTTASGTLSPRIYSVTYRNNKLRG